MIGCLLTYFRWKEVILMNIYTVLIDSMIDVGINTQLFIIAGAIFFSIAIFWKLK